MMLQRKWIFSAVMTFLLLSTLSGCDYGRMKDQEAIQTYKTQLPEMAEGAIPVTGGLQALKATAPDSLRNPLPSTQEVLGRGRRITVITASCATASRRMGMEQWDRASTPCPLI